MSKERYSLISVADVIATPDNPRIIDVKSAEFAELVKSVKASGVMIPVHVRPHPKQKNKYDLRAGERRVRAATEAKLMVIPAIVHEEMTDEEAFELTFTENFARQDLSPLEEGKAVATLMDKHKGDLKAVASKMGQTEHWVKLRAEVHIGLSKEWQAAVLHKNHKFSGWTTAHLCLIARLPKDVQQYLLKNSHNISHDPSELTVTELEKRLSSLLMLLSKATWKTDDQTLIPRVGACDSCQNRTSKNPLLFTQEDDPAEIAKDDRCLDSRCWHAKSTAFLVRTAAELKKENPIVVAIATEGIPWDKKQEIQKHFPDYKSQHEFDTVKKGTKDAAPAIIIYGDNVGEIRWVKPKSRNSSNGRVGKSQVSVKTLKERQQILDAKRWAQVLIDLRDLVAEAPFEQIVGEKLNVVIRLAATFGTDHNDNNVMYGQRGKGWSGFKSLSSKPVLEAVKELWSSVREVMSSRLHYNGGVTQTPKELIEEAKHAGELLNIDVKKMYTDVSTQKGFTVPKSWAGLNADGTPKGSKPEKKAKPKAEIEDICKLCKSAHPSCDSCCDYCTSQCNSKQVCKKADNKKTKKTKKGKK